MCEMLTTGWAEQAKANEAQKPGWRMLWRKWMMSDDDNESTGLCDSASSLFASDVTLEVSRICLPHPRVWLSSAELSATVRVEQKLIIFLSN